MVTVVESEITAAMRVLFAATHNVAEGAGAAPLAALLQERPTLKHSRVGIMLTGGNVDGSVFSSALAAPDRDDRDRQSRAAAAPDPELLRS